MATATEIAAMVGLPAHLVDSPAQTLPLGLKRIVEVARAIASGATIICLDEPVAGLDETEAEALGTVLLQLRDSGRTVLLVEHHVAFVMQYSDDLVVLDSGAVAAAIRDHQAAPRPAPLVEFLRHVPSLATLPDRAAL
jgi:branched-chain amino acid transport system permease protein